MSHHGEYVFDIPKVNVENKEDLDKQHSSYPWDDEIQKLREQRKISLFEARELAERKQLFKEVKEIQNLEDVKSVLEKILHKIF